MSDHLSAELLSLTVQIISAYVGKSTIQANALPELIRSVYDALKNVDAPEPEPEKLEPAVSIKRSVFPDYIICLEDGRKLKMLKRHLLADFDMTPEQYRAKWGLPRDYPMVAPSYAAKRSELAKAIGLGRKSAQASREVPVAKLPSRGRGRKAAR